MADALDVAVNALPDAPDDTAAGDTGVLAAGCEAAALKDAPVDAGAEEAVTVDAVCEDAVTVGAVAAGCAAGMPEAPVEEVAVAEVAGGAEVAEVAEGAEGAEGAAAANGADTEDGAVVGPEAPTADAAADAAGCDSEPDAVFVMPANEGVAASGVLFDVFAGVGAAEPDVVPMCDGVPATGAVCAAAKGSADSGFDHDVGAAELTDAGSALAKVDAEDADAGVARCVSAGNGAVSPACFSGAFQTVPVTASASAVFDAAKGAVVAAATGIASAV
ncbi:hypothetical protein [Burkholderia ambifaria]|uniref:hypothetical protein n=1 Tax=Burkholderia ambifaria TaxID=152480 RepID=UPI001D0F76A8